MIKELEDRGYLELAFLTELGLALMLGKTRATGKYFKTGQYLNVLHTVVFVEGYGSYMHFV